MQERLDERSVEVDHGRRGAHRNVPQNRSVDHARKTADQSER